MGSRGKVSGLAATLALAVSLAAAGTASADEAAALYDPATVYVVHLTLPQGSIEKLEDDPEGEYQPGQFSIATTGGTPATEGAPSAPVAVEVRLKGSTSFETLDGKAAFKLKFPKASRPSAFGLKKITLNNMVQDPSMVHETLSYEAFRATGVPAPRTGFAYVYVNGQDYGMHLNLETLDDQSMERIFATEFDSDTQHLYEGEDGADVVPGGVADFQVDEGDEANRADLEALIAAVDSVGAAPWSQRLAPYADLPEMTGMWAVEKYVGQWDGYAGVIEGAFQPNNYYLYDDPLGVFRMLPWGTDETFQLDHRIPFDGKAGLLFDRCLEDEACFAAFHGALTATVAAARSLDLPTQATTLDSMLAPWQQLEQGNGRFHYSRVAAHGGALGTAEFARGRVGEAESWLAAHRPPGGESGGGSPSGDTSSGSPGGGAADAAADGSSGVSGDTAGDQASPQAPRLRRLRFSGDSLRTLLTLTAGATIGQTATYPTADGRRTACVVPAKPRDAGDLVLECHLRPPALDRLEDTKLTLQVTTTIKSSTATKALHRKVTIPAA
jgi:hypothetical protein